MHGRLFGRAGAPSGRGTCPTWNAVVKAASDRVLTFAVIQAVGSVLGFGVTVFVAASRGSGLALLNGLSGRPQRLLRFLAAMLPLR